VLRHRGVEVIDMIQLLAHPVDRSDFRRAGMSVAMRGHMENMSNFQLWIARAWIRRDVQKISKRVSTKRTLPN
jgi:hypothetical protein